MLGGARNGYCSTASLVTVMLPSMTVRIEMTMATMGRRVKKFDMASSTYFLFLRRRGWFFGGGHQHSRPQSLQAFGDDLLTWLDPLFNNNEILVPVSKRHCAKGNLVFVVHNVNSFAALLLHKGHLRD